MLDNRSGFTQRFEYLYVEPTSACALACPRTFDKSKYQVTHLKRELFTQFISDPVWQSLKTLEYGGNYGDPVYHPELFELIKIAREIVPDVQQIVHTNGTQKNEWWNSLSKVLRPNDICLFSVDGLADTNHIYRVNSRWDWIEFAIKKMSLKHKTIWKFIVFKHNQHQVEEAIDLAQKWGVQFFILVKSNLFYGRWENEGRDPFAPDFPWVERIKNPPEKKDSISPRCTSQSMHYLSSSGYYSPCCWMDFSKDFSFDLGSKVYADSFYDNVLMSERLQEIKEAWNSAGPDQCLSACGVNNSSKSRSSHQRLELDLTQKNINRDRIFKFLNE